MSTLFTHLEPPKPEPENKPHKLAMRPYQLDAVDAISDKFADHQSTLVVMPTGAGKTVLFSHVVQDYASRGKIMVLAHQSKLIQQAAAKIHSITGLSSDWEKSERWADPASQVIVSTWQTMNSGMEGEGRRKRFDPAGYSLIVCDEAHRCCAPTFRKTIDYFKQNKNLKILGVTATPDRADEKALGEIFDSVAFEYWVGDAIRDGWLCPIMQSSVRVAGLDFSSIPAKAELTDEDIERVLTEEGTTLHAMCGAVHELAKGRKTALFWPTVKVAEIASAILNRHQPESSRTIHGKVADLERFKIYRDFSEKKYIYLNSVGVLTEGWDDPGCEVIAMGRPTKSRALFAQMAGRAMRPLDSIASELNGLEVAEDRRVMIANSGKGYCEIIDFVGNAGRHKLAAVVDILGGTYDDDIVEKARERVAKGEDKDVQAALDKEKAAKELEKRLAAEKEAARVKEDLRRGVRGKALFTVRGVDLFDMLDLVPIHEQGWDKPATEDQVERLEKKGVTQAKKMTERQAAQLLKKMNARQHFGFCTVKQAACLQKYGIKDTKGMSFDKASKLIDAIAQNGWRGLPKVEPTYESFPDYEPIPDTTPPPPQTIPPHNPKHDWDF